MNEENTICDYALSLLSQRSYTIAQVKEKLLTRFPEYEPLIEKTLFELKEKKLLDDKKFAIQWLEYRISTAPRSEFLLKYELKQKGILKEDIEEALEELGLDDLALAKQAAENKKLSLVNLTPKKQQEKIMAFLKSRGFSWEVIKSVSENLTSTRL